MSHRTAASRVAALFAATLALGASGDPAFAKQKQFPDGLPPAPAPAAAPAPAEPVAMAVPAPAEPPPAADENPPVDEDKPTDENAETTSESEHEDTPKAATGAAPAPPAPKPVRRPIARKAKPRATTKPKHYVPADI